MAEITIGDDLLYRLQAHADQQGITLESLLDGWLAASPETASNPSHQTIAALSAEYTGVIEVRADRTLVPKWVSPSFALITGYTPEEVMEMGGFGSLVHPQDRDALRSVLRELTTQATQKTLLYRTTTKDGRLLYLEGHFQSVWNDEQERVTYIYAAVRDVTELHQLQEAYRTVAESSVQAFFIVQDGKGIFANQRACEITGYSLEELLAMTPKGILKLIPPQDRGQVQGLYKVLTSAEDMASVPIIHRIIRKDGAVRWVDATFSRTYHQGEPALLGTYMDITERKQAESDLESTSLQLQAMFDHALDAILLAEDDTGRYLDANPAACRMLGYTRDELLQMTISDISADLVAWQKAREEFRETGSFFGEYQLKRRDGTLIDIEIHSVRHILPGVNLAIARDISERKLAEEALRESETRFRAIFDSSPDAILLVTPNGIVRAANPAAHQMLGYGAGELIGKTRAELVVIDERFQALITERELTGRVRSEIDYIHRDGRLIPVELTATVLGSPDNFDALVMVIARDISERKQQEAALRESETRFRTIFDQAPVGIVLMDRHGIIRQVNQETESMFGYAADEVIGQRVEMLMPPEYRQDHVAYRRNVTAAQRSQSKRLMGSGLELYAQRKDGTHFPVDIALGYLQTTDHEDLTLAFVVDMSQRKQAEEARRIAERLQLELEQQREMNELKSRFLGMVAHEFRTPMTVIVMSMARLRAEESAEKRLERLNRIDVQLQRLNRMIDNITLLSKHELLHRQLALAPLDFPALVDRIIEETSLSYHNGVTCEVHFSGDFAGLYDEWLLGEIFGNLISNAIKYSHPTGIVEIHGSRQPETITVTVRDHGIGIAETDQYHLFEAFYRAANVQHISGTGLGLVIVKQAVDAYGGTITVESQEGAGTAFTVQLPFYPLDGS